MNYLKRKQQLALLFLTNMDQCPFGYLKIHKKDTWELVDQQQLPPYELSVLCAGWNQTIEPFATSQCLGATAPSQV
jgi:hypothetical protein